MSSRGDYDRQKRKRQSTKRKRKGPTVEIRPVDSALARHDGVLRAERGAEATDEASRRGADAGANAALLRAALREEGREQKAESEMTQEVEEDRATPAKPAPKEPVLTARDAEVPPALASDIGED